jgi:hypothetical protein
MQTLDDLRGSYPLSKTWGEPIAFEDTAVVNGLEIYLAGFSAQSIVGHVVGSAAQLCGSPVSRAYFELLERTTVVALNQDCSWSWPVRDESGIEYERMGLDGLVPTSPDSRRWTYARSNGVAIAPSWREACRKAFWELTERDRVLRSWYGELEPLPVEVPICLVPSCLEELYAFEAYHFEDPNDAVVSVAGVFGFPRQDGVPLVYGFGARATRAEALASAAGESLQRLGFLWGEPLPLEKPEFAPAPDYHQEFFLHPSTHHSLHMWLGGGNRSTGGRLFCDRPIIACHDRTYADITPPHLSGRLFVAKAIPSGELPLVFGNGHPHMLGDVPDALRVHPIA